MTHTYQIEGMHCGSCVGKIKNELLKLGDITQADIRLDSPQATITMQKHIVTEKLQKAVSRAGAFTIKETEQISQQEKAANTSWISTYKPLLLVFAFITIVATFSGWQHGEFSGMHWMNNFMGGFFLVFSFFKFLDLRGFADSYNNYDLLAKKFYYYGFVYPFIELGLGLAYISNWEPVYTNIFTVIIMGFSSMGVIQSLLSKRKIRCACLGAVFNLPMSSVTVIEDLLMAGMALVSLTFV